MAPNYNVCSLLHLLILYSSQCQWSVSSMLLLGLFLVNVEKSKILTKIKFKVFAVVVVVVDYKHFSRRLISQLW